MRRILCVLALAGAVLPAAFPATASAELPPLIPREVIFGNPSKLAAQISPDGKYLSWIAPNEKDVLQVWVQTIGEDEGVPVTQDPKRGIRQFLWSYKPNVLFYMQDNDGDENYHIYMVDLETKETRDITPFMGVRAFPVAVEPSDPDVVLVGMNRRNRGIFDVYRVDLTTGAVAIEEENPGNVTDWAADEEMVIRARVLTHPDGRRELQVRHTKSDAWGKFVDWGVQEELNPVGFTPDGQSLFLSSNLNFNAKRLIKVGLTDGKVDVVSQNENYDLSGVMMHPQTKRVQAVRYNMDRQRWEVLDEALKGEFDAIRALDTGDFFQVSGTHDDTKWIIAFTKDDGPVPYYLWDRSTRKAEFLFVHRPELKEYQLAQMQPVKVKARDGLELQCYLTLPVGVPPKNLPLVLNVHGGPWARDSWGFDTEAQWLANRGYAVLQVNYRGSSGFGKQFLHAGDKEFAGKMHTDLLDAVNWAVKQGYADPKRVGIYGGSYGGYATLVGLTFTPEVFAAGVDLVGPSNLVSLIESFPAYWKPFLSASWYPRVGDPAVPEERADLEARSPLFKVDQIRAPLLIAQGANDPRVTQKESEQIVAAMKEAGKPVEYLVFEDEGHGLARPENRLKFYAHAERFLAEHLGGRAEPIPSAMQMQTSAVEPAATTSN